jgi:hypothetical protein
MRLDKETFQYLAGQYLSPFAFPFKGPFDIIGA